MYYNSKIKPMCLILAVWQWPLVDAFDGWRNLQALNLSMNAQFWCLWGGGLWVVVAVAARASLQAPKSSNRAQFQYIHRDQHYGAVVGMSIPRSSLSLETSMISLTMLTNLSNS